jgi:thiamine biosynthesis lipoprotein
MQIWYNTSRIFLAIFILASCSDDDQAREQLTNEDHSIEWDTNADSWSINQQELQGKAQGTTYLIKTSDDSLFISPEEASSFFKAFDLELSTYMDSSLISQFNDNQIERIDLANTDYFKHTYNVSQEVSRRTSGGFDPTVFPLVEIWGFFKSPQNPPKQNTIDSTLDFVGFLDSSLFMLDENKVLFKKDNRSKLDFNAVAQGQSADEIAKILDNRGQQNYFIEVGGEIVVKGNNGRDDSWIIGVDQPKDENDGTYEQRQLENLLKVTNRALATSGSYRKFYIKNGQKFSHTIDPKTGRPVNHNLLSVTVLGPSAAIADAYATAFMTMGVKETLDFIERNDELDLEVYLLFENNFGKIERAYSAGLERHFIENY